MTWRMRKKSDIKTDVRVVPRQEILDKDLDPCGDCGRPVYSMGHWNTRRSGTNWSINIRSQDVPVIRPGSKIFHYVSRQMMESPGEHNPHLNLDNPEGLGYRYTRCGRYFLANQTWDPTDE